MTEWNHNMREWGHNMMKLATIWTDGIGPQYDEIRATIWQNRATLWQNRVTVWHNYGNGRLIWRKD